MRAGRAGGNGILVVAERLVEFACREPLTAVPGRRLHHGLVARAGWRRDGRIGRLLGGLQIGDLLFELIQFGLLLIELALVLLDRVGEASSGAKGDHDRQSCCSGNPRAAHIYLVAERYAAVNARTANASIRQR